MLLAAPTYNTVSGLDKVHGKAVPVSDMSVDIPCWELPWLLNDEKIRDIQGDEGEGLVVDIHQPGSFPLNEVIGHHGSCYYCM